MRHTVWALALAAAITFGSASAQGECWTTSDAEVDTGAALPAGAPGPRVYVDAAPYCNPGVGVPQCHLNSWVYQESNGLPGLQRDDEVHSDVDTCTDGTNGDTIIF